MIDFFVPGTPIAQGSKRHVGNGVMVESAKGLKDWRRAITDAAWTYRLEQGALTGPLEVVMRFYQRRPKSHYVAGDPAKGLKQSAPIWVTTKPDIDKTVRAVLDAVTASGIWRDDAQVVRLVASKRYTDPGHSPGVWVRVDEAFNA